MMSMPSSVPYAQTRYYCESSPPPDLRKVVTALINEQSARGLIRGQNVVRGISASASREYIERGPADDLARFLLNERVLVAKSSKQEMVVDEQRAELVIEACQRRCRSMDLEAINWKPPSRPSPVEEESDVDLGGEDTSLEISDASHAWRETMRPFAANVLPTSRARYVMYLTPVEEDVWTSLVSAAEVHGEEMLVPIPQNDVELYTTWASQCIRCSVSEYRETLLRFVRGGILEPTGNADVARVAFRFLVPIDAFFVVQIKRRTVDVVDGSIIELLSWLQDCLRAKAGQRRLTHAEVIRVLARRFSDATEAQTWEDRFPWIFGAPSSDQGEPERGLFLPVVHAPELLMAYPGFFPFTYILKGKEPSYTASIYRATRKDGTEDLILLDADEIGLSPSPVPSTLYLADGTLRPSIPTTAMLADVRDDDLRSRQDFMAHLKTVIAQHEDALETEQKRRVAERERQARLAEERATLDGLIAQKKQAEEELRLELEAKLATLRGEIDDLEHKKDRLV